MRNISRIGGVVLVGLLVCGSVAAGQVGNRYPSRIMGSHEKSDAEKASIAYARGLRLKVKAEEQPDPDRRRKLLEKARKELSAAVGYAPNYEHQLALGQVYLQLGKHGSAFDACTRALAHRPESLEAKACVDSAGVEGGGAGR